MNMKKRSLVVFSVVEMLTLFPAVFFAQQVVMIMDAPGAENNPINYVIIFSVWAYPVCVIFGLPIAWIFRSSAKWSKIGLSLPLIPINSLIISFFILHLT